MYKIADIQCNSYLEWTEKSYKDHIERIIWFHNIDTDMRWFWIHDLLDFWWQIYINTNEQNITDKVIKYFEKRKNRLWIKKKCKFYFINY